MSAEKPVVIDTASVPGVEQRCQLTRSEMGSGIHAAFTFSWAGNQVLVDAAIDTGEGMTMMDAVRRVQEYLRTGEVYAVAMRHLNMAMKKLKEEAKGDTPDGLPA